MVYRYNMLCNVNYNIIFNILNSTCITNFGHFGHLQSIAVLHNISKTHFLYDRGTSDFWTGDY